MKVTSQSVHAFRNITVYLQIAIKDAIGNMIARVIKFAFQIIVAIRVLMLVVNKQFAKL